eukprot:NODE_1180_length_2083_cov_30.953061_g994_i0.p1 GENE.NODE_1180_length_2083_cov_30.953061_g994_i0~~NODE_1180_length_2083_cov_30.953061_g994_i0.p1  ORF type:complete len:381 (+),score=72.79 NODE_1180_length_2083_cov_30.953061_g994_i0:899-2041(+)
MPLLKDKGLVWLQLNLNEGKVFDGLTPVLPAPVIPDGPSSEAANLLETVSNSELPEIGKAEFYEVVIGDRCPVLHCLMSSGLFQSRYGVAVLAIRHYKEDSIVRMDMERTLEVGDCLLVLGPKTFYTAWSQSREFFVVSRCGFGMGDILSTEYFAIRIPECINCLPTVPVTGEERGGYIGRGTRQIPIMWWPYLSVISFVLMVTFAALGYPMFICAMCNAVFLVAFGVVSPSEAIQCIDWKIVVLIGSSFGVGASIERSGLATVFATLIHSSVGPFSLLLIVAYSTSIITTFVTNNAAAIIIYPLATGAAREIGMPIKSAAAVVAIAASYALSSPVGYQTNLMVVGPGGYKHLDFLKMGIFLDLTCPVLLALVVRAVYGV